MSVDVSTNNIMKTVIIDHVTALHDVTSDQIISLKDTV
jgi:hypothetical protein